MRLEVHETKEFRRPCEATFLVPSEPEHMFVATGERGGLEVARFFLLLGLGAEETSAVKAGALGLDDLFTVDSVTGQVASAPGWGILLNTRIRQEVRGWGEFRSFIEVQPVDPLVN